MQIGGKLCYICIILFTEPICMKFYTKQIITGEGKIFVCFIIGLTCNPYLLYKNKKTVEELSRKLYNYRDKTRRVVLWQVAYIQK